ncbi:hypothetical protein ACPVCS_003222 [Escherichia coli]|uniref:hypothetical protein n=1 Tax=Escherichia coli TaxID=562 RepID=UPI002244BB7D|nr:hypothetical protein [Escherichia coli]MCW8046150.1 hypothetical protein [Escherichia coli]
MSNLLTDPANHPANGPLPAPRIERVIELLKRSNDNQNGGNMAYVIADAIKGLEELLVSRDAVPVAWWTGPEPTLTGEIESIHDHETGSHYIPLYPSRAAMLQSFGNPEQLDTENGRDELPYDPQIAEYEKIMQQAIPDGWALVPVEPTKEMIDAGWLHFMGAKNPSSKGTYKAMLAAAPQGVKS